MVDTFVDSHREGKVLLLLELLHTMQNVMILGLYCRNKVFLPVKREIIEQS